MLQFNPAFFKAKNMETKLLKSAIFWEEGTPVESLQGLEYERKKKSKFQQLP